MSRFSKVGGDQGKLPCLIQSLLCDKYGVGDGSLLKVHQSPSPVLLFDGTDQTEHTEFRTEIHPSPEGVITCIRWNHNPDFCLAATRNGKLVLEQIGNNQNPMHLFRMQSRPHRTELVSFTCLAYNKQYVQCDTYGKPYMSTKFDPQAAVFKIIPLEDMMEFGEPGKVPVGKTLRRMFSHG